MTKQTYRVKSNQGFGIIEDLGTFQGTSPENALDTMAREEGYDSMAHCLADCEGDASHLIVTLEEGR